MKTKTIIISLSTILVCLAASAQTQQRASGGGLAERFKQLEKNGDGKVSREEGGSLPFFEAADKSKDGFLTIEEVQSYFAARRTARPATPEQPSAPLGTGELTAVDAVFELCVRNVEACAKFYRDGIGMREVEPRALLEWAGCYLRLRKVAGTKPEPAAGNPMKQMLSQNGFRWFSLWYIDPGAISDRLVKAGYPAPMKGGNVSMTRDPDGNVVEIMGVPRSASSETFTWGMAVSDDAAARKFYGEKLGLREFDPWNLPPPFSMKMHLFATGARRIHAGMVAAMDDAVGRVLGKVRALDQEENTLIFFYSDNGGPTPQTTASNEPLRGYKGQFYEGGIRVPFLAQWKSKLPAGAVYREMVMAFDIHATALAVASIPFPTDKPLDGVNLLPFLTGKETGRPHEQLFWRAGERHAARVGDWKLVQERSGGAQLFNLKDDIGEHTDLAAKEAANFKELQAAYMAWDKQMMPAQWRRQDARTQRPAGDPPGARRGGRIEQRFKQLDRNRDGRPPPDEFSGPAAFRPVDKNSTTVKPRELQIIALSAMAL